MMSIGLFGYKLPLEYYNWIAKDIPKAANSHDNDEDDTCGPFTSACKDVSNPNRQNTWPCVVRTSMAKNVRVGKH